MDGIAAALELTQMAEDMLRQRLRREHPDIGEREIEREVRAWYERRPGAELGDAAGRPRIITGT